MVGLDRAGIREFQLKPSQRLRVGLRFCDLTLPVNFRERKRAKRH